MNKPPAPTAKESRTYEGCIREYADKPLWFDTSAYGGYTNAYEIVKGNGDGTFQIDAFINSTMGELCMSRMKYEMSLLGIQKFADPFMIQYWRGRQIIQAVYDAEDAAKTWLAFMPMYMTDEASLGKRYPVVFCFHGNGGSLFEAVNHGFVDICYDNEFIVVCPENANMDAALTVTNLPLYLDRLESEGYPIDRARIYVTGMSKGGMAAMYTGIQCESIVAAVSAHGCAGFSLSVSGDQMLNPLMLSPEQLAKSRGMPLYLVVGESDMRQLPLSNGAIEGLNRWLQLNGCARAGQAEGSLVGITADASFVQHIDGTEYEFARFHDSLGVNKLTVVGIAKQPHWVAYSYATLAWGFLSRFSRVEGALVYNHTQKG